MNIARGVAFGRVFRKSGRLDVVRCESKAEGSCATHTRPSEDSDPPEPSQSSLLPLPSSFPGSTTTIDMSQILSSVEASIDSLGQHATLYYAAIAVTAGIWTAVDVTRKLRSNGSLSAQVWATSVSHLTGIIGASLMKSSPGHYRTRALLHPGAACRHKCT